MTSTVAEERGWLGRVFRVFGGGVGPSREADEEPTAADDRDAGDRAAALVHRQLNAIRMLLGRRPVDIETNADPLWIEVALREHLDAAGEDGGPGRPDDLADRVEEASRWSLTRFRQTHVATTEALAGLLAARSDELPDRQRERLVELLRSCEALGRELRGSWLQTEFERGPKDPAEKSARGEVGEGVREVRERALAAAEEMVKQR